MFLLASLLYIPRFHDERNVFNFPFLHLSRVGTWNVTEITLSRDFRLFLLISLFHTFRLNKDYTVFIIIIDSSEV